MKPSATSGVSSSFYLHSGKYDTPPNFHHSNPLHQEVGKSELLIITFDGFPVVFCCCTALVMIAFVPSELTYIFLFLLDVEFTGKDTKKMQSNFFIRTKVPNSTSASGNEKWHELGFDASLDYHVYGIKWLGHSIEWYVDGRRVRRVLATKAWIPSPACSPMRIVANIWPVERQLEEWAGPLDKKFSATCAGY